MLKLHTHSDDHPLPTEFLTALRNVDEVLHRVEQMIVASQSHSPFNHYLTRLAPCQVQTINNGINDLRSAMLCLTRPWAPQLGNSTINTAWAIRQTLKEATAALSLASRLHSAAKSRLRGEVECTEQTLQRMNDVLHQMEQSLA